MLKEKEVMEPLISIGIPVRNGFQNKTRDNIDLESFRFDIKTKL